MALKEEKEEILRRYFDDIVERDIALRYNIPKAEKLKALARYFFTASSPDYFIQENCKIHRFEPGQHRAIFLIHGRRLPSILRPKIFIFPERAGSKSEGCLWH